MGTQTTSIPNKINGNWQKSIVKKLKRFKPLFKNIAEFEWRIFSYDPIKADVEIEDSDDLETEINEFMPSGDDESEDDDVMNQNKYLKIRVVFFKIHNAEDAQEEEKVNENENQNNNEANNQKSKPNVLMAPHL